MANTSGESRVLPVLAGILVFVAVYDFVSAMFFRPSEPPFAAAVVALVATAVPGVGLMVSRRPEHRRQWLVALCLGFLTSTLITRLVLV